MIALHAPGLRCDHADAHSDGDDDGVLARILFSGQTDPRLSRTSGAPTIRIPMPALDTDGAAGSSWESWRAGGPVSHGRQGIVQYGKSDDILFGAIQLSEGHFTEAAGQSSHTPLHQAAALAYRSAFEAMQELQFPHVLRFWNYIADINGESHGIERYRQFNSGRQEGFLQSGHGVTDGVPAASAVGFASGPLTVCFLAARAARPLAIENPRQVSAYRYPASYGPRSPTFSRAGLVDLDGERILFVSGTASIVGHETCHHGDVVAQTAETMTNIRAILAESALVAPDAAYTMADLQYRVYVRDENDLPRIRAELQRQLGGCARFVFLKADICRRDLLLEIEATAGHAADAAA